MTLVLRTSIDPQRLEEEVRQQLLAIDKDRPLYSVTSMEHVFENTFAPQRYNMILVGLFASLALILAAIGIYGAIAYSVSRRSREIGVRLALGAKPADVLWMVLRQGGKLAGIGVLIGLITAWAATRLMRGLLYGVGSGDVGTYLVTALVILVVAFIATYIPARRATNVDPIMALRYE
jgi:ABC-type antimicrobial peptide transport system permease subunit